MNPSHRFSGLTRMKTKKRRNYRKKKNSAVRVANPRMRKRRSTRRRRRNAGIRPFVAQSNPLILQNPRRSRRRRRNPAPNFKTFFNKSLVYSGGAAIGAGANILALRHIENDWMRNGARLVSALAAGHFLKGDMGAAASGALLYPMFAELALMANLTGGSSNGNGNALPTGVDLNELAADLEAALDEVNANELMYVP